MENTFEPFEFTQSVSILKSIGKKARNLHELMTLIGAVSEESLYHHTYQYFSGGHILEYTNEFAYWAGENLGERILAEHLSNIDPYDFQDIADLRKKLLEVIDGYLKEFPEPREALPGDEFYFNETVTMMFPVGIRARNLAEFLIAIKYVDGSCLYYHFYEARRRLGRATDDFSRWFDIFLGKKALAEKISAIDPFMHTIEGIRAHIVEFVEEEVRIDMGVAGGTR